MDDGDRRHRQCRPPPGGRREERGRGPEPGEEDTVDGPVRLPALRSAGIMLLRKDRATDFAEPAPPAAANTTKGSFDDIDPLTADDLMLGLRIDVRLKGASRWTSLVRRNARYTVDGAEIVAPTEEEGHVKVGAAVRHG